MAVASLLDAGADEKVLLEVLKTIPAHGFDIKIGRVSKSGLDCCDFNVVLDKDHENHEKIHIIMPMNMFTRMGIRMNIIMNIIMSIEIYLMLLL